MDKSLIQADVNKTDKWFHFTPTPPKTYCGKSTNHWLAENYICTWYVVVATYISKGKAQHLSYHSFHLLPFIFGQFRLVEMGSPHGLPTHPGPSGPRGSFGPFGSLFWVLSIRIFAGRRQCSNAEEVSRFVLFLPFSFETRLNSYLVRKQRFFKQCSRRLFYIRT